MGNSSAHSFKVRAQSSKKHGDLPGYDVPASLDEEERRPAYRRGRSSCPTMDRQHRHSRFGKHGHG